MSNLNISSERGERVAAKVVKLFRLYPGIGFRMIAEGDDRNNPYFVSFANIVKKVCKVDRLFSVLHGLSDTKFFAVKGISAVMT